MSRSTSSFNKILAAFRRSRKTEVLLFSWKTRFSADWTFFGQKVATHPIRVLCREFALAWWSHLFPSPQQFPSVEGHCTYSDYAVTLRREQKWRNKEGDSKTRANIKDLHRCCILNNMLGHLLCIVLDKGSGFLVRTQWWIQAKRGLSHLVNVGSQGQNRHALAILEIVPNKTLVTLGRKWCIEGEFLKLRCLVQALSHSTWDSKSQLRSNLRRTLTPTCYKWKFTRLSHMSSKWYKWCPKKSFPLFVSLSDVITDWSLKHDAWPRVFDQPPKVSPWLEKAKGSVFSWLWKRHHIQSLWRRVW